MKRIVRFWVVLIAAASAGSAFEPPSAAERVAALGDLGGEPEVLRRLLTPDDDFAPIREPAPGDWLAAHKEKGQTFDQYRNAPGNRPDATRHVIYLLPLGKFGPENSPPIEEIRAYAAAFFQMDVQILPAVMPAETQFEPRVNPRSGRRQIRSTSVMDFLATRLPADAYCLLGVTMEDLYPAPSWNYVFGKASLDRRVGIYSFARYDPDFFDEARPKDYADLILRRSCKVLAHEIGHMFGLQHCIYYDCLLNGSNNLEEADACPQHLCPVCLRKLQYDTGFDAVKRYEELAAFYHRHHWSAEANWVYRQLAKIPEPRGVP
jgi:archaemetzincin